ncbi:MAG: hypothetical protein UT34_C0001G0194 [candidate division WS6 bacterium GW2011_GWF2_39_15]|uniref:Uncharacterized protein n=1 Tax=candidate division WS6 bacterium GW2011_GWF2_39_15 TaxID=1619100 RepID=A0A0G0MQ57_9BACT|nr:MAG: hypothetical protein UT34_C0001G0194 [candidate division WS6 bacterium GW2011_GWF2_39_15]
MLSFKHLNTVTETRFIVEYRSCRDGGIGRREGLKILFSKGSGGSIPPLGIAITIIKS